jgi:hypothetical protein
MQRKPGNWLGNIANINARPSSNYPEPCVEEISTKITVIVEET